MRVVERGVPFSRSILWRWNRERYEAAGIDAWDGTALPFRLVSSVPAAERLADIVLAFLLDLAREHASGRPVEIIEIGGGSGLFAFNFLNHLGEIAEAAGLAGAYRYVLTDFAAETLRFWQGHEALRPFVEAGTLRIAPLDIDRPGPVGADAESPAATVVLANYLIDSLRHDAFEITASGLVELGAEIRLPEDVEPGDHAAFDAAAWRFEPTDPAPSGRYGDPALDGLLGAYAERTDLPGTRLVLPTAFLAALPALIGDRPALLLAVDKGYAALDEFAGKDALDLTVHGGCFSVDVNFDALRRWTEARGGVALHPEASEPRLQTMAYLFGAGARPATVRAVRVAQALGMPDLWDMLERLLRSDPPTADGFLALLRLARWDPHWVRLVTPRLLPVLGAARKRVRRQIAQGLRRTASRLYRMPGAVHRYAATAKLLTALGDHATALTVLEAAVAAFGPDAEALHDAALCRLALGDRPGAVADLERALALDPDHRRARMLLALQGRGG